MLNNLIESKAKKQRSVGATITSIVINGSLAVLAVYATANAAVEAEKPKEEKVEFVEMKKDEPPPPKNEPPPPPPPDVAVAPPPPKGFQVLTAPVEIPDVIPEIDLSKKITNEADFSGKGVAGGVAKGDPNVKTAAPIAQDQPYFEFQVEKPVVPAPGNSGPRYPEILKSSNVEGEVLAQFVVDTLGRVEPGSFKPLKSSHELFTQAVRQALSNMRFLPAEVGGRKVKQLVQLPFEFALSK